MNRSDLASKLGALLNEKIDIPKVPEWVEGFLFKQVANITIGVAEKHLPEDWFDFVIDSGNGLIDEDVEFLKNRFESFINPKIDLPYLNEEQEGVLMKEAIGILLNYLKIGEAID